MPHPIKLSWHGIIVTAIILILVWHSSGRSQGRSLMHLDGASSVWDSRHSFNQGCQLVHTHGTNTAPGHHFLSIKVRVSRLKWLFPNDLCSGTGVCVAMVWVRSSVYFYKRNDTFYFSRAVPSDLRHRFSKKKVEVCLSADKVRGYGS